MRLLVTGGAGYIGSHAVRHLLEHGHDVWIYDNLSRGHAQAVPANCLIRGELADTPALEAALRSRSIEAVVHFAALTYVGESTQEPERYYQNNVVNTLNLLAAMRRTGVNQFVFSSTAATYGSPEKVPISEDEPLRPINPYGRGKMVVELALADYAAAYGLAYVSLRYFNAAGANPAGDLGEDHDPETHLIPLILQVALGHRACLEVFGTDYPTSDGTCVRDYVHVQDLAEAHRLALNALRHGQGRCFNLGNSRGHSVREVHRACEEVTGKRIPIRECPRRPGDPPVLVASSVRAEQELGWRPRFADLHKIVETAWRWHSSHPRGYGRT
jgi:UDP-glucose 4-epimerase